MWHFIVVVCRYSWHIISVIVNYLKTLVGVTVGIIVDKIDAKSNKVELSKKSDKVAIVTGGSRGIGSEVVKMLLECDMEVIIACRNLVAGETLINSLRKSGITTGIPKVYQLDNSNMDSVRQFAADIRRDYERIDILINNAGIIQRSYEETVDGFEEIWAINYLSHFLLTALLLPVLRAAGRPGQCSRIVNVSSCMHLMGTLDFNHITNKDTFISTEAYARSKLAQVMSTISIQDLFTAHGYRIKTYAVHPGVTNTTIINPFASTRIIGWIMDRIYKAPRQAATSIVWAAISETIENKGGIYSGNCLEYKMNKKANDPELRQRLMKFSLESAHLNSFIQGSE